MKKILLLSILLLSFLLLNGCGKKEITQNSNETNLNDDSKIENVEFKCDGMHCAGCEIAITTSVNKLKGIKQVYADAGNKIVKVSFNKELTTKEQIEKMINAAGYDTETSKSENKHDCDTEKK